MNLFRNAKAAESLKGKHKVQLLVEQLDERLVPAVTASFNAAGLLVINGDSLNNNIRIEGSSPSWPDVVRVFADGQAVPIAYGGWYEPAVSPTAIEVYGHDGNDTLWTDSLDGFRANILMSGGGGNDLLSVAHAASYWESMLIGGTGRDILVGGPFTDRLNGNAGRDVLIGGWGADFLYGGDGEDLLMPSYTEFDLDMPALRQIRAFWANTNLTYNQRVDGLLYRTNGYTGRRVDDSTVHRDSYRDEMFGDGGMDFFYTDYDRDDVRDTGGTGERLLQVWR